MNTIPSFDQLSDQDLLAQVRRATQDERQATAHLIALLMELDARKLYLREGCSSLFTYCTQQLHLSEHAATFASKPRARPNAFRSFWNDSRMAA